MIATQKKYSRRNIDLTEGPILAKFIKFVLPLMATNFLQTFYNAADMMVVSMSSEPNAVGAIGATGSLTTLIINLFMGFSVGTNILVARYLGAKDHEKVNKIIHTSVIMSMLFGLITAFVGLFASRTILTMMGADGNLLDLATLYTKIYFCGAPFLAATNYLSAIFRAKGDTKTPLMVLSATGLVNVGLNVLFVLVFGMSVDGVAVATAAANLISAATLIYLLSKDEGPCHFSFKSLCLDGKSFGGIVKEGLPAGIQGSLFSFSSLMIQSSIFNVNTALVGVGSEYAPVINGTSAMSNLDHFINTAVNAGYQASITFTSQNYGAKKYKRIKKVILVATLLSMAIGIIGGVIIVIFRNPLLSLYGIKNGVEGSMEALAYKSAMMRMTCMTTTYALLGFMNTGTGAMRGLGKTLTSTVISLIGACLFRIAWVYVVVGFLSILTPFPTLALIYAAFPVTWIITGIAQYASAYSFLNKKIAESAQ